MGQVGLAVDHEGVGLVRGVLVLFDQRGRVDAQDEVLVGVEGGAAEAVFQQRAGHADFVVDDHPELVAHRADRAPEAVPALAGQGLGADGDEEGLQVVAVLVALGGAPGIGLGEVDAVQHRGEVGERAIDAVVEHQHQVGVLRRGGGMAQAVAHGAEIIAEVAADQDGGAERFQGRLGLVGQLGGIGDEDDVQAVVVQRLEIGQQVALDLAGGVEMDEDGDAAAELAAVGPGFDDLVRAAQEAAEI